MRQASGYRMRLMMWVAVVACFLLGAGVANADFTFGEPTNLGPQINDEGSDGLTISSDGLSIFFFSDRLNESTWDLYTAVRESTEDEWDPAVNPGSPLNGPRSEGYPSISADGLELFYTAPSWQAGWTEFGQADLWVSRRSSVSVDWSAPQNLGAVVNTPFHDTEPSISADGLELYFGSNRPGGYGEWNIWVTTRRTKDDPWQEPVNLGPTINSGDEFTPNISANGLALFFGSSRSGGYGESDIWLTTRKTKTAPWGYPVNLGPPINDSNAQWAPCLSHDNSTLYFTDLKKGPRYGYFDIWQVEIIPVVDFNGDGKVDGFDIRAMADRWGTDVPSCDIAPMAWGDGIVDVEDLKVLAEYIGKDVVDGTLVAHWALDETEGDVAGDSAGDNDGTLMGDPIWEPEAGMVGGALQFDGLDDCIETPYILNPADGPFSVLAWIKGGEPGQVLISQVDGTAWLMADPSEGTLMTELLPPQRRVPVPPLVSEVTVTDGIWHRAALVWDGVSRSLYADGTLVATDELTGLVENDGGLYIGCGAGQSPESFFSGLIDDVRIYNRAVRP